MFTMHAWQVHTRMGIEQIQGCLCVLGVAMFSATSIQVFLRVHNERVSNWDGGKGRELHCSPQGDGGVPRSWEIPP